MAQLAALVATGLTKVGTAIGVSGAGAAAAGASTIGTIVSGVGALAQGAGANKAAEFQAQQLEVQGKNDYAVAAKKAAEIRRRNRVLQSEARATGAAFGGGVDIRQMAELEEAGELDALTALWQGESTQEGRSDQAWATRFEGRQRRKASVINAGTSILTGGSDIYNKYKLA